MSHPLLFCAIFLSGIILIRLSSLDYSAIRYNDYLREFNKSYGEKEFRTRMIYFENSLKEIEKLNSAEYGTGAVHGLTKFSDWSIKEKSNLLLKASLNTCKSKSAVCYDYITARRYFLRHYYEIPKIYRKIFTGDMKISAVPDKLDWRDADRVIGAVENQKLCNGCWSFGIVSLMEAMAAIHRIGYDHLSVQQLLDCSTYNKGCKGGNIDTALEFLCTKPYKLTAENKYPLKLITEQCRSLAGIRGVKSYDILCQLSDDEILERLVKSPVIAVIHPTNWLSYNSGVITRNCFSGDFNMVHVVLIVGYGTTKDEMGEDDIPYYIVKNTWGADWGEDGYIRIARGPANLCGIRDHIAVLDVV